MNTPHRFEQLLSAYVDGELGPDEMTEVREHIAGCAACRAEIEDLRGTKRLLTRLRAVEPPRDLEARILASVDQEPRWRWFAWPRPALAAVAVALAVVLVAVPLVNGYRDRLRAAEVSPDLFIRTAVQSAADDPFMDRAYISLVSSDTDLRLAGEEPRGPVR
jgi:anti-sigma factor RsiW